MKKVGWSSFWLVYQRQIFLIIRCFHDDTCCQKSENGILWGAQTNLILEKVFALATDWCLFLQSAAQYCAQPNMQTWCAWNAGGIRPHDYLWGDSAVPLQTAPPMRWGLWCKCAASLFDEKILGCNQQLIYGEYGEPAVEQHLLLFVYLSHNLCTPAAWGGGGVSEISKRGWTHPSIF